MEIWGGNFIKPNIFPPLYADFFPKEIIINRPSIFAPNWVHGFWILRSQICPPLSKASRGVSYWINRFFSYLIEERFDWDWTGDQSSRGSNTLTGTAVALLSNVVWNHSEKPVPCIMVTFDYYYDKVNRKNGPLHWIRLGALQCFDCYLTTNFSKI